MSTNRLVKWSKESKEFFEKAEDNSIVLDIFISYSCASQTGEGFEELVNSLNSENIKSKLKKINIIDTSYLYRHVIPNLSVYSDPKIPTEWYLNNKESIEKLKCNYELKSWVNEINIDTFMDWYKQIMIDYNGDKYGNGVVQEFRDSVIAEAAVAAYKGRREIKDCVDFMLEECAHACATFTKPINLAYPMRVASSLDFLAERYNLVINHLKYRASIQTQNSPDHVSIDLEGLSQEVVTFMKDKVSNVNFFVMDKYGNHIYKNYAYDRIVGNTNFSRLDPKSWKISLAIMKERKQRIIEEKSPNGNIYVSVKAPLIINGKVEGIIGLAIDITDRKKREGLEKEAEVKDKLYKIAKEVAHDICSPLAALECVKYTSLDK
ncbi:MAG: hypothetical protein LBS38_00775, partial [Endomicrobium sp.]|nr:hypothetical protein [Endomicrobium sp.]